ncbi:hypothetical protein llap_21502 [Limosa lapponica baueri]|uniref:Uncharacterized protein n=1 Tax=Limosa lapponica baueri TaxID=1758121 RepID=A0A2I0T336_LIMLA|nr:hypothetical protein llap_21502 [Limosa lapponica baueri]
MMLSSLDLHLHVLQIHVRILPAPPDHEHRDQLREYKSWSLEDANPPWQSQNKDLFSPGKPVCQSPENNRRMAEPTNRMGSEPPRAMGEEEHPHMDLPNGTRGLQVKSLLWRRQGSKSLNFSSSLIKNLSPQPSPP